VEITGRVHWTGRQGKTPLPCAPDPGLQA
jgi:hypothetical protein